MHVLTFFFHFSEEKEEVAGVVAGTFADHDMLSYYLFPYPVMTGSLWYFDNHLIWCTKFNLNGYGTQMQ